MASIEKKLHEFLKSKNCRKEKSVDKNQNDQEEFIIFLEKQNQEIQDNIYQMANKYKFLNVEQIYKVFKKYDFDEKLTNNYLSVQQKKLNESNQNNNDWIPVQKAPKKESINDKLEKSSYSKQVGSSKIFAKASLTSYKDYDDHVPEKIKKQQQERKQKFEEETRQQQKPIYKQNIKPNQQMQQQSQQRYQKKQYQQHQQQQQQYQQQQQQPYRKKQEVKYYQVKEEVQFKVKEQPKEEKKIVKESPKLEPKAESKIEVATQQIPEKKKEEVASKKEDKEEQRMIATDDEFLIDDDQEEIQIILEETIKLEEKKEKEVERKNKDTEEKYEQRMIATDDEFVIDDDQEEIQKQDAIQESKSKENQITKQLKESDKEKQQNNDSFDLKTSQAYIPQSSEPKQQEIENKQEIIKNNNNYYEQPQQKQQLQQPALQQVNQNQEQGSSQMLNSSQSLLQSLSSQNLDLLPSTLILPNGQTLVVFVPVQKQPQNETNLQQQLLNAQSQLPILQNSINPLPLNQLPRQPFQQQAQLPLNCIPPIQQVSPLQSLINNVFIFLIQNIFSC